MKYVSKDPRVAGYKAEIGEVVRMAAPQPILEFIKTATFSLWKGATGANAAGTEVVGIGQLVAANSSYDWYGMMRLDVADFLVGGAGTTTALTIQGEGEIGVSG